jgi:hypothetical protein
LQSTEGWRLRLDLDSQQTEERFPVFSGDAWRRHWRNEQAMRPRHQTTTPETTTSNILPHYDLDLEYGTSGNVTLNTFKLFIE